MCCIYSLAVGDYSRLSITQTRMKEFKSVRVMESKLTEGTQKSVRVMEVSNYRESTVFEIRGK